MKSILTLALDLSILQVPRTPLLLFWCHCPHPMWYTAKIPISLINAVGMPHLVQLWSAKRKWPCGLVVSAWPGPSGHWLIESWNSIGLRLYVRRIKVVPGYPRVHRWPFVNMGCLSGYFLLLKIWTHPTTLWRKILTFPYLLLRSSATTVCVIASLRIWCRTFPAARH